MVSTSAAQVPSSSETTRANRRTLSVLTWQVPSRHITDLRHTLSFGSNRGYEAGQAALVRQMCSSGARLQLAIAPAGAGKTTAMRALVLAWTQDGGQVVGLAPSAAAAAVLAEQSGIRSDTLAKLTWALDHGELPDWAAAVRPSTLVIIDEAGMADTLSLDAAVQPDLHPTVSSSSSRSSSS